MQAETETTFDYLSETRQTHATAYQHGYGVQYPEGHIIRCYEQVLRAELGLDGSRGERVLDFGCGTGTHCGYFLSKGFDVYGVDADPSAIEQCKARFADVAGHFAVVDPKPDALRVLFDGRFDVVLANQVLYYLSDLDLKRCVECLYRQLVPGGVFIASMMVSTHYLFGESQPGRGVLRRVMIDGKDGPGVYSINFTASKEDLCRKFARFKPLHVGHYDFSILDSQPSRLHYLFVGRKNGSTTVAARHVTRRHGKPLNYFRLGKGFREGADFMRHMKTAAEGMMTRATQQGARRRVDRCPICGSTGAGVRFEVFGFPYSQCPRQDCRHVFVSTLVDEELRNAFFRDDEEYSRRNYCDPSKSAFRLEHIARPKVDHILGFAPDGASRWLDIGCGSGEILAVLAERAGWSAVGLELSGRDAAFGREHYHVDIREQLLDAYRAENGPSPFDVVSMFGVLHCVEQPGALVRQAADLVAPGGILVTEVANYESVLTRAVQTYPEHPTRSSYNGITTLHQFTEASIRRAHRSAGLEPISVWYFGTDVFEVLNQWCFSDGRFPDSPLEASLSELANDIQGAIDAREQSSNMLWIARRPG